MQKFLIKTRTNSDNTKKKKEVYVTSLIIT